MGRMTGLLTAVGVAIAMTLPTNAQAQQKWVRGTVKAVAGDTVTVTVQGKDMAFKVDAATEMVGSGLGTKTRAAQAAGEKGLALSQALKAGDKIEVHYAGDSMKATEIRTGVSAPEGMSGEAKMPETGTSARGVVTAVGPASVTVKGDTASWTFDVDAKTKFVGSGLGTATRQAEAAGKAPVLSDMVKVNDRVVVTFHDMAGKLHATEVRVIGKS